MANIEDLVFNAGCLATAVAGSIANNYGLDGNVLTIAAANIYQNTNAQAVKDAVKKAVTFVLGRYAWIV